MSAKFCEKAMSAEREKSFLTPEPIEAEILERVRKRLESVKERFPFHPSPYVILEGGGTNPFTLCDAITEVVSREGELQEERNRLLNRKQREALIRRKHGSSKPSREQTQIKKQFEKSKATRLQAREYPKIGCILKSPNGKPFEIPPGVSPLSDSLPMGGETHPFYYFVCSREPPKALEILRYQKRDLEGSYTLFLIRSTVQEEYDSNTRLKRGQARDLVLRLVKEAREIPVQWPEEIQGFVKEISNRYNFG